MFRRGESGFQLVFPLSLWKPEALQVFRGLRLPESLCVQNPSHRPGAEVPESPEDNFTTVLEREWNAIVPSCPSSPLFKKTIEVAPSSLNASDKRPRPSVPTLQRCLYMIEICFQKKVVFLLCLLSVFRALSWHSYKCWEAPPQATIRPYMPRAVKPKK